MKDDPNKFETVDNDIVNGWFVAFALFALALCVTVVIRSCQ